ncbi:hypothetical protein ACFSGI_08825 [Paenibacillus nicotianae]|uniref:Uncharacterized protein n=1 Tax=Paenibacillus nicotianae TaxID=1526551 RepID=A0ABW4URV8_9BACL
MIILRDKKSNVVMQKMFDDGCQIHGHVQVGIKHNYNTTMKYEDAEQLFTESEVQKKIESAVAEHEKSMQDTLQGYYDNEQQLLSQIEELKAKLTELQNDALEQWYDEERKLKQTIGKMLIENNELKAKLPQPVEVSKQWADAIEWVKKAQELGSEFQLVFKFFDDWNLIFLSGEHYDHEEMSIPFEIRKSLGEMPFNARLNIIKNGYTVKPEPLREGIASLVARYTNDDGIKDETDLIDKLAEYARDHFSE